MAGLVRMQIEVAATTARFLSDQADDLSNELADIARYWSDLSARWIGRAGSAFEPAWDEWHEDATTVTAILVEHSDLLARSVGLLVEHENHAATALVSVVQGGDAR